MIVCDNCGSPTRMVVPVLRPKDYSAKHALSDDRPISRLALYALGVPEPPWGEHPNDDNFQRFCKPCAEQVARTP